jgi:hypothetical protein
MTRDEIADTIDHFDRLIPPEGVRTTVNAKEIVRPATIASFQACLQTEVAKDHPELGRQIVRTMLVTRVDAYSAIDGEGEVLELGIPVCPIDLPWRLDVQQKVPTSLERDSVTDAFRRSLVVSAANAMAERMTAEDAQSTWATEALSDARIGADACYEIVNRRFGPRTVVATPGDPIANATAEANGCVVVHGGAMPAAAWSNIRKHGTMFPASVAFPTRKPEDRSKQEVCPLCKQAVR